MKSLPIKNLAPAKPLIELKETTDAPDDYLGAQLRELTKDLLQRDEATFREIAETSETVSNFVQGKQIFQYNMWANEWRVQDLRNVNPNKITSINIMQFYLTDNLQRIVSSNPDLEPEETFLRTQYRKKVQQAKAVWNYYEKQFYTHWFNQQEALHALISGTYIESVQYDHLAQGAVVFKEIFGEQELEISPGMGKCLDCEYDGSPKEFSKEDDMVPRCPKCGSFMVQHAEPVYEFLEMPMHTQPLQMGAPRLKLIPIQACRFDLKGRAEQSSYFIERRMVTLSRLRHILGQNIQLPEGDVSSDRGLQVLENMHRAGNTISGAQSEYNYGYEKTKQVLIDRVSLLPEEYAHVVIKNGEKTLDGKSIPDGTRLVELCPRGLTMIGVDGMKSIFGIYPDVTHQEEVSTGVHHMRYESGIGRGGEDTVEVQKRFNRFDSQHVRSMESAATPGHTFIEGSVDTKYVKKIGHPNVAIPVKMEIASALGQTDLISQLKPATIAGNFFDYTYNILNQYRQLTAHSTTFSNGLPGVDNTTATGARIGDANAASIYIPMLQIKAEVRCSTAQKTIRCVHKHYKNVSQFYPYGKTETGQVAGEMISGDQLDPEIRFTVVRDSELPKNRYNRQQDFERMMASVGGIEAMMAIKQSDPEWYDYIQATYGQEIHQRTYSMLEDICRDRLEQAKMLVATLRMVATQMAPEMAQVPLVEVAPPELVGMAVVPAIVVEEPTHEQKAKWFSDWLDTPEGFAADQDSRQVAIILAQLHLQLATQQAAILGRAAGEAQLAQQAPFMEAEAAGMQAERDAEAAMLAQEGAQDQEKAVLDAELDVQKQQAAADIAQEAESQPGDTIVVGQGGGGGNSGSKPQS